MWLPSGDFALNRRVRRLFDTRGEVTGRLFGEGRDNPCAVGGLARVWAAGMERAAGRRRGWTGDVACENNTPARRTGTWLGHRGEQRAGVRVSRRVGDCARVGELDNATEIHHGNTV